MFLILLYLFEILPDLFDPLPDLFESYPYIYKDTEAFPDIFETLLVFFATPSDDVETLPHLFLGAESIPGTV